MNILSQYGYAHQITVTGFIASVPFDKLLYSVRR